MRKIMLTLGVVLTVVVAGAEIVSAQRGGAPAGPGPRVGGPGERRPGIGGPRRPGRQLARGEVLRGLRQLDLTTEQKTKIRDVAQKSRAEARPLMQQVRAEREAVRAAVEAGTARETARADAKSRLDAIQKQLADIRQKTRAEMLGILTPEQAAKLSANKR